MVPALLKCHNSSRWCSALPEKMFSATIQTCPVRRYCCREQTADFYTLWAGRIENRASAHHPELPDRGREGKEWGLSGQKGLLGDERPYMTV